jgi:hypothetical protein
MSSNAGPRSSFAGVSRFRESPDFFRAFAMIDRRFYI